MISHIVEDKDAQFLDTIGFVFLQITFTEIIKVVVKLKDDQGGVVQQCLPNVPVAREKLQWLLCPMQDSAVYKTSNPEKKANADEPKAKMPSPKKKTRRAGATATGKAKAQGKAKGRAGRGKGAGRGKPGSRKKKAQAEEEDEEDLDLDEEGQARKKRPAAPDSRGARASTPSSRRSTWPCRPQNRTSHQALSLCHVSKHLHRSRRVLS